MVNSHQLPNLDQILRFQLRLYDLASLFKAALETIDNNDAALFRVLVVMVRVLGGDGFAEDVRVDLGHVGSVGADARDVAALAAAFVGGEELGGEEGLHGGGGAEDYFERISQDTWVIWEMDVEMGEGRGIARLTIGFADLFFQ